MKILGLMLLSMLFINVDLISQDIPEKSDIHCDSIIKSNVQTEVMFYLAGRKIKFLPSPNNPNCETGLFTIDIWVNKNGDVIDSKIDEKKSSELSDKLLTELIKTAKDSKFQPDKNSSDKQRGNILYKFKKKE